IAVGPARSFSSASNGVPLTAMPRRAFFTTRYSHPLARNSFRSLVSASTVSPRKSASTRLWAFASFSFNIAMFDSLTARSTANLRLPGFELRDQRRRVQLHARTHGGRHRDRLHVGALGRRRLEPHQRLEHDPHVGRQLLAAERRLADARVD